MRSATAQADVAATPEAVWTAITSPAHTRRYMAGLSIISTWQPDDAVDALHGTVLIATGTVVAADVPSLLVYRLDEPQSGDVDCWLTWQLEQRDPGITRVTLIADTMPCDPPVDTVLLLSQLKTYLEAGAGSPISLPVAAYKRSVTGAAPASARRRFPALQQLTRLTPSGRS